MTAAMILSWSCRTDCRCSRLNRRMIACQRFQYPVMGAIPSRFSGKVAAGENGGAAANWIANHLFQRDPITLAAMSLTQTKRMRVTLMAMSPLTVHPVQAAMAAATLDEFFPGRVTLCLGVGAPADLKSIGIGGEKSLRIMREALELARALLAGETVTSQRRIFSFPWAADSHRCAICPLILAASGPKCWSSPALPLTGCS